MKTITGQETTQDNTRLMRIGLAEPESWEFWRQASRSLSSEELLRAAFEERWFGSRTMPRVRYLLQNFQFRFSAFPEALAALHQWNPAEPEDRRILCHFHLQLSDPMYRQLTSTHLPERLQHPEPTLDRNAVTRWVESYTQGRWAAATTQRMTAGLMGVLNEVGYSNKITAIRPLSLPKVSDRALAYILYVLRETQFEGQLNRNPYLASLALSGSPLENRLDKLPGIEFRKMSNVKDLHWKYAGVQQWSREAL